MEKTETAMPIQKLLKVPEVADWLSVSPATVYSMASTQELIATKVRGAVRFERRDVQDYLEKMRKKTYASAA